MINSQVKAFFYIVKVLGNQNGCQYLPSNDQVVNAVVPLSNLMHQGYFTQQKLISDTWVLLGDEDRRDHYFKPARSDYEALRNIINELVEEKCHDRDN